MLTSSFFIFFFVLAILFFSFFRPLPGLNCFFFFFAYPPLFPPMSHRFVHLPHVFFRELP